MTRIAIVTALCVLIAPAALAAGQVPSPTPAVSHAQVPAALYGRA